MQNCIHATSARVTAATHARHFPAKGRMKGCGNTQRRISTALKFRGCKKEICSRMGAEKTKLNERKNSGREAIGQKNIIRIHRRL